MTVSELITQLSAYNPSAQISSWCVYSDGEIAEDANGVTLTRVVDWEGEDKALAQDVHIECVMD